MDKSSADTTFVGINHARLVDLELSTITASQLHRRPTLADEILFSANKWIRAQPESILSLNERDVLNRYIRDTKQSNVMTMTIVKETFVAVFKYYQRSKK